MVEGGRHDVGPMIQGFLPWSLYPHGTGNSSTGDEKQAVRCDRLRRRAFVATVLCRG